MGEIVLKNVVEREAGFLFYVDGEGSVWKQKKGGDKMLIHKNIVEREPHHLYYIDKPGNICKAKMIHAGRGMKEKKNAKENPKEK